MQYGKKKSKKRATYDDVLAAPPEMVAEVLDGELVLSPRPAPAHAYSTSALGGDLNVSFGRGSRGGGSRPGGWFILHEPELHLGDDIVVPDMAGWRRERMNTLPDAAYFTLPPDWACEVVSPSSARIDRIVKMNLCASCGVGHFWLVDPLARTLEVYALRDGCWMRVLAAGEEQKVRAEPFAEVELELADWWAPTAGEPGR